MKTIWKFETPFEDKFTIEMPTESEILCVQQDQKSGIPCIWALVYPMNSKTERHFELFGTGHNIHEDMGIDRKYIGTYQVDGGNFVGHLFERID